MRLLTTIFVKASVVMLFPVGLVILAVLGVVDMLRAYAGHSRELLGQAGEVLASPVAGRDVTSGLFSRRLRLTLLLPWAGLAAGAAYLVAQRWL